MCEENTHRSISFFVSATWANISHNNMLVAGLDVSLEALIFAILLIQPSPQQSASTKSNLITFVRVCNR